MATISVRITDDLRAQLEQRGEVSTALRSALTRWYAYLGQGLREVQGRFSDGEQALLADICNGAIWEPFVPELLAANVEDCEPGYFEKWGCDREALVAKLEGLTHQQQAGIVDAIERFWQAVSTRSGLPDARKLLDLPGADGDQ
jgi:hypothetical protein